MQGLWLYLHFPQLQLDNLLAQQEQEEAVIIVEPNRLHVVQLNHMAYQAGIRQQMNLGAAAALCEDLRVLPYQDKVEQDVLRNIAHHLYSMTSDICFFAPSGLLLRVHTMLNLYAGLSHYWLALQHQLTPLQITFQYATGNTPLAAKLLALQRWNTVTTDSKSMQQVLQKCALSHTDLDTKSIQKLNRVGIQQLGELMAIPLPDIAKRFQHDIAEYLGRITGTLPQPVTFYHPEPHFHHYLELLYEIEDSQRLLHPLRHLLKALEHFLRLRDKLTTQIHFTLHVRDKPEQSLFVGSQQGEYRTDVWERLVSLQLETLTLTAPVVGISLDADKLFLRQPDKLDLFTRKQGQISRLQLIAMLQAKLGNEAVFTPCFADDHRPEQANQRSTRFTASPTAAAVNAMRPTFLLAQPTPLTQQVTIEHGPERIQTGWWDDATTERDYFIARTPQGQWYWIFRTPAKEWFLHGIFS